MFIEKLFDELKTIPDLLKTLFEIFKNSLAGHYPDSIHINEIAMVCLGDYLSATYVFGEKPDEAMSRAIDTALLMLEQNRQLTQDDNIDRAWAFVSGWIIANQNKFNNMSVPPVYGKIDEHDDYLVIPAYLHKALEDAGFSSRKVFRGFGDRGYVKECQDPDGTKRLQQLRRIDGKPCRVYVIRLGDAIPDEDTISIRRSSQYLPDKGVFTKDTKTETSDRTIRLPVEVFDMLKTYRALQNEERLRLGKCWLEHDRLFTTFDGSPIFPDTITHWFGEFIRKTDLPKVSIHSLRHTNITLLIMAGVPLQTVAKRAGHSSTVTTSMIYSHAIQSVDEMASDVLADILKPKQVGLA